MPDDGKPPTLRWGVLGAANIALKKVIPAIQRSETSRVVAIASRDAHRATVAARDLGIERAHGSYEALLADPEVDAVYNPLPNHLHVPWSIRAVEAGKHVLCEKPIGLTADDARTLRSAARRAGVVVAEAFMVRAHPQWIAARQLARSGRLGDVRLITGHFSYYRRDPDDIRSRVEWGGGALLDIGCYPITMARWIYGEEPIAAVAQMDRDPDMGVDRLVSALLRFPSGQAVFTCAGQLAPFQQMHIFGTVARIEIEIPFNAPADQPCRILIDDGRRFAGASAEVIELPAVDQYTLQADRFADAVRGVGPVLVSLDDAIANMTVIDALFRSAATGAVVELSSDRDEG